MTVSAFLTAGILLHMGRGIAVRRNIVVEFSTDRLRDQPVRLHQVNKL